MTHIIVVRFFIDRLSIFHGIKFDEDIYMKAHDDDYVVIVTDISIVLLWLIP